MSSSDLSVIAVDWSGRSGTDQSKTIWSAECAGGRVVSLGSGRSRDEVAADLISRAEEDPHFVVGFDFAFSVPEWYLKELGFDAAPQLWQALDTESLTPAMRRVGLRHWLNSPEPPFWTTTEAHALLMPEQKFRRTEREVTRSGSQPKSIFQLVDAGQVGRGSLYGMQALHRLRAAGFSIWPVDPSGYPLVVEIFPRLLTGAVRKSDAAERARYLESLAISESHRLAAAASEDAFDALVSAIVMAGHLDELMALQQEPAYAREGKIWHPSTSSSAVEAPPLVGNRAIEDAAIAWVIELEREAGRDPRDTRDVGAAADVESPPRTIEVKAFGGSARGSDLLLEPRQLEEARRNADFCLYVVENVRQGDPSAFRLKVLRGQQLARLLTRAREYRYYELPWPVAEYDATPEAVE